MWTSFLLTILIGGGAAVLLLRHNPSRGLLIWFALYVVAFRVFTWRLDVLLEAQRDLALELTPAVAERSLQGAEMDRLRLVFAGIGRALVTLPVLVPIWGLLKGVSWAIFPLLVWLAISVVGFLGVPSGVLG